MLKKTVVGIVSRSNSGTETQLLHDKNKDSRIPSYVKKG